MRPVVQRGTGHVCIIGMNDGLDQIHERGPLLEILASYSTHVVNVFISGPNRDPLVHDLPLQLPRNWTA